MIGPKTPLKTHFPAPRKHSRKSRKLSRAPRESSNDSRKHSNDSRKLSRDSRELSSDSRKLSRDPRENSRAACEHSREPRKHSRNADEHSQAPREKPRTAETFCGIMSTMRRLGRWMINGLTVLLVLLCVGTVVLWVRSYWVESYALVGTYGRRNSSVYGENRYFISDVGGLCYFRNFQWTDNPDLVRQWKVARTVTRWERSAAPARLTAVRGLMPKVVIGWGYTHSTFGGNGYYNGGDDWGAAVPYWGLVVLFGMMPAIWAVAWWRRQPRADGRCLTCDYDLTGNVSGVCPECGMAIAKD